MDSLIGVNFQVSTHQSPWSTSCMLSMCTSSIQNLQLTSIINFNFIEKQSTKKLKLFQYNLGYLLFTVLLSIVVVHVVDLVKRFG